MATLVTSRMRSARIRQSPPEGFSVSDLLRGVYTFQRWEIFPGYETAGEKDVAVMCRNLGLPEDLTEHRVLDIAPWNGFFSFECARRGAAEVVSFGPDDPDKTGYNRVREVLGASNCTYVRGSVYDLKASQLGTFDTVLFLGLIYHLRHPLLALDRIYDVCQRDLYVDSPIIDRTIHDQTLKNRERVLSVWGSVHDLPLVYFTKASETGDAHNWFLPNLKALRAWVESSGFVVRTSGDDGGGWAWLSAHKSERAFTPGLEGYNPGTENYSPNNRHD